MIQLVFATTSDCAFGADGGMPWPHISQDFKNFKARTEGSTLIMGVNTFNSLPCKLPGRKHIVVRDPNRTDTIAAKNGDEADQLISINGFDRMMNNHSSSDNSLISVIGGAKLLEAALPYADLVSMTMINYPLDKEVTTWLSRTFLGNVDKMFKGGKYEVHLYRDGANTICENVLKR